MRENWKLETQLIHAGQEEADPVTDARAVPIYQTTSYVFDNCQDAADRFALSKPGNIYTRITNPTSDAFEKRMTALEGGVGALATATGSAAVTYSIQNIASAGDHVVSANTLYGGTYNLFAHTFKDFGIDVTLFDPDEEGAFEEAFRDNTKAVFIESLGNPNSNIIDIRKVADYAHSKGVPLIVDNTFSPYILRPIEYGADVVVHSTTKFIGGHGLSMGGVVVDCGTFDWAANDKYPGLATPNDSYHGVVFTKAAGKAAYITKMRTILMRDTGATISPFHSFFFLQGLETLAVRMDRHIENTMKVIAFLADHPNVAKVNHPSLADSPYNKIYKEYFPNDAGSIFTIEVKGGAKEATEFVDRLKLFSLLANVADVKSLVVHPATTTHSQMNEEELLKSGIKPNSVRLSIGIENADDIIADLKQALK